MIDPKKYLLRTDEQEAEFRKANKDFIRTHLAEYARWIYSLPLWEWYDFLYNVPTDKWRLVIGMICVTYIDGLVNISISSDGYRLRREPRNEEEYEYLMRKLGFRKPQKSNLK